MSDESKKSIFSRRPGSGRCMSILEPPRSHGRSNNFVRNGNFNMRHIAEQVRQHGSVDFQFSGDDLDLEDYVRPIQAFYKPTFKDAYDIRDMNFPKDASTDVPTADFHRGVRQATSYRIKEENMQPVTEDGGVRKRVLKEGKGEWKEMLDGCRVWLHYDTYLDNGPKEKWHLHDSTADHGMAASLEIGNEGLPGLQFGIKTMKVGEVAEFAIKAKYAYGSMGIPGFVGKNQDLRMVVELREVKEHHRKPLTMMNPVEKKTATFNLEDVLEEVESLRQAGRDKFDREIYTEASIRYNWALELLDDYRSSDVVDAGNQEEVAMINRKSFLLYSNLALCYLRSEYYLEAENACDSALKLRHHDMDLKPKVIYRRAMAMYKQDKFEEAKAVCARALRYATLNWGHVEFRDLQFRAESARIIRDGRLKIEREGMQAGNLSRQDDHDGKTEE